MPLENSWRAHRCGLQPYPGLLVTNYTLRPLVQPVDDMDQCIAGHDVGVGLGAPLGVEGAGDVAELTEDVEAVDDNEEVALEEGSREAGIPDEVAGVQVLVGIAGAGVEAEVGAEVELPRQLQDGGEGGATGEGVEVLEVGACAGEALPCGLTGEFEVVPADVGLEGGGEGEGEAADGGSRPRPPLREGAVTSGVRTFQIPLRDEGLSLSGRRFGRR